MSMKEIVLAIAYVLSIFVALICSSCVGVESYRVVEHQIFTNASNACATASATNEVNQ
jgi:hypothetical protein